jgi:hypothetical protein
VLSGSSGAEYGAFSTIKHGFSAKISVLAGPGMLKPGTTGRSAKKGN